MLARTQPARSTTPERSTTPGSSAAERRRQGRARSGPSPRRRRARRRAARPASACPGAARSRADRDALDGRPVDEALAGDRSARRPTTVAAAPSAEPTRKPACQTRSSRHDGRRRRPAVRTAVGHRAATRELDELDVGEGRPEQPAGEGVERLDVAGRQLAMRAAVAGGRAAAASAVPRRPGASRPLIASSSASADAVAVAESTIATRSPAIAAMTGRSSG